MTPHERLAAHLKTRPETPRPLPPLESPAYKKWRKDMDVWLEKKAELVREVEVPVMNFERQTPIVTPSRSDEYVPRERGRRKGPKGMRVAL